MSAKKPDLHSVHPEMPDGTSEVSRSEMRDFAQDQGNRGPKAKRLGTEHPKRCKENKGLRGDVLEYVAQESPQFDVEIGQKHHFRMETSSHLRSI